MILDMWCVLKFFLFKFLTFVFSLSLTVSYDQFLFALSDQGMLPPLDAPHHLRKHEWEQYREGNIISIGI